MPNPEIRTMPNGPYERPGPTAHNGYLALVPGKCIAEGHKSLPRADAEVASPQHVEIEVPDLGLVRIRYAAYRYRHGRNWFWAWRAEWADKISDERS